MLYTDMTKKALKLSFEAHKDQVDKSGMPYVYHPFHLAEQMQSESETVVALLHDVVEDTEYTLDDIKEMGFSDEVIDALVLMTHDESVPYMDYVAKIKSNPIATAVKLADLKHNSDLSRIDTVNAKAIKRVQKYIDAVRLLTGEDSVVYNLGFTCYFERYAYLKGEIKNGCLHLESTVYGDDCDSEKHYSFSREATVKLFSVLTLNEFIELCRIKGLAGAEKLLSENDITYESTAI